MSIVGYINGQFVDPATRQVPLDERGHQFGDGVYEVLRVYDGRPFLLDWHLQRLRQSLRAVAIANPHDDASWTELLNEAVRRSGAAQALIYLQVTRGIAVRGHLFPDCQPSVSLTVRPFTPATANPHANALVLPDERWANAWIKTLNLLPNIIAKETAHQAGADEALLVREGSVTEGSSSNAWFVRNGVLWTAPANRYILNGVTRRFVLELARSECIEVRQEAIRVTELDDVDEVFFTGTTVEIQPVLQLWTYEHLPSALSRLPLDPVYAPESGTNSAQPRISLWERTGKSSEIATQLSEAFTRAVSRFRNRELPVLDPAPR